MRLDLGGFTLGSHASNIPLLPPMKWLEDVSANDAVDLVISPSESVLSGRFRVVFARLFLLLLLVLWRLELRLRRRRLLLPLLRVAVVLLRCLLCRSLILEDGLAAQSSASESSYEVDWAVGTVEAT